MIFLKQTYLRHLTNLIKKLDHKLKILNIEIILMGSNVLFKSNKNLFTYRQPQPENILRSLVLQDCRRSCRFPSSFLSQIAVRPAKCNLAQVKCKSTCQGRVFGGVAAGSISAGRMPADGAATHKYTLATLKWKFSPFILLNVTFIISFITHFLGLKVLSEF